MVHKREKLTTKELAAQKSFLEKLRVPKRKTKQPVVVAMIGLVGSGKSAVAQELGKMIGAAIIGGDDVRVELRKQGERYERARAIIENVAPEVIAQGGNLILDSDFIDSKKRASIREKTKKAGVRLVFVRVHCDVDVMIGRALTANYRNEIGDFFGGASTRWIGTAKERGAAVKVREMWRRTPHHYKWVNQGGGKWILRKLPFSIFANIDTTDRERWWAEVKKCADKLL